MKEKAIHLYIPAKEARTFSYDEYFSYGDMTQYYLMSLQVYLLALNGSFVIEERVLRQDLEDSFNTRELIRPNSLISLTRSIFPMLDMTLEAFEHKLRISMYLNPKRYMFTSGEHLYTKGFHLRYD